MGCSKLRTTGWLSTIAFTAVLCMLASSTALAQDFVQLSAGPIYLTSPVIQGQTNIAAKFRFNNQASGAITIDMSVANNRVHYVPSCGSSSGTGGAPMCTGTNVDAGVFTISGTGS